LVWFRVEAGKIHCVQRLEREPSWAAIGLWPESTGFWHGASGEEDWCVLAAGGSVMPQLHLPMFPRGVTPITDVLAFAKQDGQVTYFSGQLPVFSHPEDDLASFRMITSQFCVNGGARQSDIIRAFGVTPISLKRSVKIYREKGPKGFYARRATRGPAVLVAAVVEQAEERLAEGATVAAVAEELEVKLNTLQKAIRAGRVRTPQKKSLRRDRASRSRRHRRRGRGRLRASEQQKPT